MDLRELISSIDIVDFIGQYVDLQPRNDEYFGLSPFKEEKTPSFSVRRDPPLFYDFSSGKGGNVYDFAKYYFKRNARDTIKILEGFKGIDGIELSKYRPMSAVLDCSRYAPIKHTVKESANVILPNNCMEKYEVNWDKAKIWEDEGISRESMTKFGVKYDPLFNRLVYPIMDLDGNIRNIGSRTLDKDYKAKGLRKYSYTEKWGTVDVIYALYENMTAVKSTGKIIIVEGMKSVLKCDTWGIHNSAAILTSHLNPYQFKILLSLNLNEIVFALDNDVDVHADSRINELNRFVNVTYLHDYSGLLQEKDAPVDEGRDVFEELCKRRHKF